MGAEVDWGSIGSDHAVIRTYPTVLADVQPPKEAQSKGYDLDADNREE